MQIKKISELSHLSPYTHTPTHTCRVCNFLRRWIERVGGTLAMRPSVMREEKSLGTNLVERAVRGWRVKDGQDPYKYIYLFHKEGDEHRQRQ